MDNFQIWQIENTCRELGINQLDLYSSATDYILYAMIVALLDRIKTLEAKGNG
jgi:hypothetical protein